MIVGTLSTHCVVYFQAHSSACCGLCIRIFSSECFSAIGEDPEVVAAQPPLRNSPRPAEFQVDDGGNIYFILIEQSVLCQVPTFNEALYVWFCSHYIFHLSYCNSIAEVCMFFQEFLFGLPAGGKRSATYPTTATDIQQLTIR